MNNLKTITELVSIPSFSEIENEQIINYLIKKFSPYSKEILKVRSKTSNKDNLLIGINTYIKNTEAIILSGHIDTVIADETSYNTNPYQATLIDDKLYGLGIIDMKCFFASIIDNLEMISNLNTPIIVAITCDEETTLEGIKLIIQNLKQNNVEPIISLIGEPTSMNVCTTSKSCYEYKINIFGKSCHSSNPSNGINTNYITAKLICEIEILNSICPNTTLNCGIMQGGEKVNIVPSLSSISFDIRSSSQENVNKVLSCINKKIETLKQEYSCNIEIENILAIPPLEKTDSHLLKTIIKNLDLTEDEFVAGCEAGYFQQLGGEAILFGTGNLALAHKPNEFLNIKDFAKYNTNFIELLQLLDKVLS